MKHFFSLLFIITLSFAIQGCRQQDFRTVNVNIPTVCNEACQKRVVDALRPLKGIDINSIAFTNGTITVRYDSMMLGLKNIEHAIKDAGFDANEFPADPQAKAKLPKECQMPAAK